MPFEIAPDSFLHKIYYLVYPGLPVIVLLTLGWSIRKKQASHVKISIVIGTILVAIFSVVFVFMWSFKFQFGSWVDAEIIYRNKSNPDQYISEQYLDNGALGYNGNRIVKQTPFLGHWIHIVQIDTAEIDKDEWMRVREAGEIKFP